MDRFAPPEDPIELYEYDHIDERGTPRYYAGLVRFFYYNPTLLDGWKPWQRLKQFELLAIIAAIAGLFFQIYATAVDRREFREEMAFNRGQWDEQQRTSAWALIAAAADPEDVGNIGARFALETLNGKGERLDSVRLPGSDLQRADLKGAILIQANLEGADLGGANLEGTDLFAANLEGASLYSANLKGAILGEAKLEDAFLREANLEGATLLETNLENANLSEANLEAAWIDSANLKGVDLGGANLEDASLYSSDLKNANLGAAILEGVDLVGANLEGVKNLDCSQLTNANGWEKAYRDYALACGEPIPEKSDDSIWNDATE